MMYDELQKIVRNYNWDDGFELPQKVLSDERCDLALALEIFYLGDGYRYFQMYENNIAGTQERLEFISKLYDEIVNGKYEKMETHFEIPLSKVQRYQLRKNNISEVLLTDL